MNCPDKCGLEIPQNSGYIHAQFRVIPQDLNALVVRWAERIEKTGVPKEEAFRTAIELVIV